MSFYMMI